MNTLRFGRFIPMLLRRVILTGVLIGVFATACGGSDAGGDAIEGSSPAMAIADSEAGETVRDRFARFASHMSASYAELEAELVDFTAAMETNDWGGMASHGGTMRRIARTEIDWLNRHKADEVADECWYRAWSHWFHAMLNTQAAGDFAMDYSKTRDVTDLEQYSDFLGPAGDLYADAIRFEAEAREEC